ncbi:glycoside hydrolase family 43 protein [Cellulomonas soli]
MSMLVNPLVLQRADPWVLRHEGRYLFTASHPRYDRIVLRGAEHLEDLQDAPEHTIWTRHEDGPLSHLIWAPELHHVNGRWYVYFAAAPHEHGTVDAPGANETFAHRVFVLECADEDPLTGTWVERGQLDTGWESFALDATSFMLDDVQYLVWAQQDLAIRGHSNIYIARMDDPLTLGSPAVMLSKPEFDWEIKGFWVNEGPAVLVRDGVVHVTFSGAATGIDYAMGLLTAPVGADLLDAASWTKHPEPVFVSDPSVEVYGPGHNSFTETEDGQTVLVYHARSYRDTIGDPLWDPNRHARAQVLPFVDGRPVWGTPVADGRPTPTTIDVLTPDGRAVEHAAPVEFA